MSHYAVIFPEFWTGTTGRAIRSVGRRDAQLLALYLMTGPGATMIGLYPLRLEDVRHDTGLPVRAIECAFDALAAPSVQFADYDDRTAHVWVREMAKFKLGLNRVEGGILDLKDKRAVGARRLYELLQPNPFLGSFFDRYHSALHLKKRRDYVPPRDHNETGDGHNISGLEGASKPLPRGLEGARKPEISTSGISTQQGSEIRDQEQERTPARETHARRHAQALSFRQYCRLAREAFQKSEAVDGSADLGNVTAWFKQLWPSSCGPHDAELMRKAIDAVDAARARSGSRRSA